MLTQDGCHMYTALTRKYNAGKQASRVLKWVALQSQVICQKIKPRRQKTTTVQLCNIQNTLTLLGVCFVTF